MSTSILVKKMREAAEADGFECTIDAYPVANAPAACEDADILLLGPQVRFEREKLQNLVSCPVEVVDMAAYGMMNGMAVIKQVRKALGE